ncbi:hypothetical protein [Bifidobacterium lemurum]|nr:hypothetical protein [Bifidobacterium lemurum]QOL33935.1 hypothetical protein BL8807_09245 [Bifidobacterium lemurum]
MTVFIDRRTNGVSNLRIVDEDTGMDGNDGFFLYAGSFETRYVEAADYRGVALVAENLERVIEFAQDWIHGRDGFKENGPVEGVRLDVETLDGGDARMVVGVRNTTKGVYSSLDLPMSPESLKGVLWGRLDVDEIGDDYVIEDFEDVGLAARLGIDPRGGNLEDLNLMARIVGAAQREDPGFLDMLATVVEASEVSDPLEIANLAVQSETMDECYFRYDWPEYVNEENTPDLTERYGWHKLKSMHPELCDSSATGYDAALESAIDVEKYGRPDVDSGYVHLGERGYVDKGFCAPASNRYSRANLADIADEMESSARAKGGEHGFRLSDLLEEGEVIARYTLSAPMPDAGYRIYECIAPEGSDDIPIALGDTLVRIKVARTGHGDADTVLREVMGVEPSGEIDDDSYGVSLVGQGYALRGVLTSWQLPAVAADPADPLTMSDVSAASGPTM